MYYICQPNKVRIYINDKRRSMAAIQSELGCDAILNGGLYDMMYFRPVCHLKADGVILADDEGYIAPGYGWNVNDLRMMMSYDMGIVQNFISCITLVQGSSKIKLSYPTELAGKRGRSAIGLTADGKLILFCSRDGTSDAMTPEELQQKMLELGAATAIMLDGGGSSQCMMPSGTIRSSRIVQNYIAVWSNEQHSVKPSVECPYAEPTRNIQLGSIGQGAKWVQWYLNQHGASISVDGIFGRLSVAALSAFQSSAGLAADGICGLQTRAALKKLSTPSLPTQNQPDPTPIIEDPDVCPYQEPTSLVKYWQTGDNVRWVQWHLKACGYNIDIDGSFGPSTLNAIKAFQRFAGVEIDGVVGSSTRTALKASIGQDLGGNDAYRKMLIEKRERMLDYIESRVGDIYVYGSQGEPAGDKVIDWSARCFPSYTTAARAARMKQYVKAHPLNARGQTLKAHDCSGLFWAAENLIELPLKDGIDVDDATAAGLYYDYCVPIQKEQLQPLDLVFNADLTHVGVVGRGGKIYEAAGSDIGVVVNDGVDDRSVPSIYGPAYGLAASYTKLAWTKFGRLKIYANEGI